MTKTQVQVDDKVTTVHGEELTVLDVKTVPVKRNGQATGETMEMFLAESGGHKTWFPVTRIRKENN